MRWLLPPALVLVAACVGRLPRPPYVQQTTAALEPVTFPPPPARVEFVPAQPRKGAVWIDGEWAWQGRRWAWRVGRWVMPPASSRFSPWTMVRSDDGTIYCASGVWVDAKRAPIPEPAALATGSPTIADVPDPEGTLEHTGKTIRTTDSLTDGGGEGDGGDGASAADGSASTDSPPPGAVTAADAAAEAGLP